MNEIVYHIPALLKETIDGLNINPDGVYVDVTFGGGGPVSYTHLTLPTIYSV